jgi:hypothetical protein
MQNHGTSVLVTPETPTSDATADTAPVYYVAAPQKIVHAMTGDHRAYSRTWKR